MENVIKRHWNLAMLAIVLFVQLMALAYQVRRTTPNGSPRLIRVWAVSLVTPFEDAFVHSIHWTAGIWDNYIDLRHVRQQNAQLQHQIENLRLQEVRLREDASQAHRLQALLGFKEQYITGTVAAQVISTTGSEFTRGIYIDKGWNDGIRREMPVITAAGVVGKVYTVYRTSSLVLEINDPSSGAGVILEKSRLQGILRGDSRGATVINNIMADEKITPGDRVLTSGGDRVYPKGLPIGTVEQVLPGEDTFLRIRVKPAADLARLEEVLVITKVEEKSPDVTDASEPQRAADILARRLPTVAPPADGNPDAVPPPVAEWLAQQRAATKAAAEAAAAKKGGTITSTLDSTSGAHVKQPHEAVAASSNQESSKAGEQNPAAPDTRSRTDQKTPAATTAKPKPSVVPVPNAAKPAANSTKDSPH